jgi:hypothetical protein
MKSLLTRATVLVIAGIATALSAHDNSSSHVASILAGERALAGITFVGSQSASMSLELSTVPSRYRATIDVDTGAFRSEGDCGGDPGASNESELFPFIPLARGVIPCALRDRPS